MPHSRGHWEVSEARRCVEMAPGSQEALGKCCLIFTAWGQVAQACVPGLGRTQGRGSAHRVFPSGGPAVPSSRSGKRQ